MSKILAITTGDIDGIGLEVTRKALVKRHKLNSNINSSTNSKYLIFMSESSDDSYYPSLPENYTLRVSNFDDAISEAYKLNSHYRYIEIASKESPVKWIEQSTVACLKNQLHGLITGPVSKISFINSGLKEVGHTPLLQKLCNSEWALMGFLGSLFNVILISGHIPINSIEAHLRSLNFNSLLKTIETWLNILPKRYKNKKMGLLGLNPHSGENGLIGDFEHVFLASLFAKYPFLDGPLVPDAAFLKENWSKYSFFLALYHDQGLIPFKSFHGHSSGTHVTVGLPIIRTSVDHGTACNLFQKNLADSGSMLSAIEWCEKLSKNKES